VRKSSRIGRKTPGLVGFGLCLALLAGPARGITVGAFGAAGEGGSANGQVFEVGAGGAVFELDAFVGVGGLDLNGAAPGTTAQLSVDALPTALTFGFSSQLSDGATDLTLTYELRNDGATALADVRFYSFLDAEIDEPTTSFFNEFAETSGTLAPGQSFEVDEPGYVFGDVFVNLQAGTLDGVNALPVGSPDDVAMALGFDVGTVGVGEIARIEVMVSEDEGRIGSFAIAQRDDAPGSDDVITYSGRSRLIPVRDDTGPAVPEPTAGLLYGLGVAVALAAHRRSARSSCRRRRA